MYKKLFLWPSVALLLLPIASYSQTTLSADIRSQIDNAVSDALSSSGVPSASIAIVKDKQIAYLHAYGEARTEPRTSARPEMCYSIGSISKQFTATAILMLAEDGKLSLDDPVSRYVPNLTRGNEVTIRQLLSHTSGYRDYWPQDYVPPFMLKEVKAQQILDLWARKPLDFDPGTQWQYSNTNFVIAGLIVEKVSGMTLLDFLSRRIFTPLGMRSVTNIDQNRLTDTDATGYTRYGLGPLRVAPKEARGWLFAAGELAMPAQDLAKWDISIMEQRLLKPASYREFATDTLLKNGLGTGYGLGVNVSMQAGHRVLAHGGEVSGFTAENLVFPDDGVAIVVLTNEDAVDVSTTLGRKIAPLMFPAVSAETEESKAHEIFEQLQQGKLDRARFTDNCNAYFSSQALADFVTGLGPLGKPASFTQMTSSERGGMTFRLFQVRFSQRTIQVWERVMPDGKVEQYQVMLN